MRLKQIYIDLNFVELFYKSTLTETWKLKSKHITLLYWMFQKQRRMSSFHVLRAGQKRKKLENL